MMWLQGILAVALLAGAVIGWIVMHRKFRGDDTPLMGAAKRRGRDEATGNELEAFIAAYREGKVDPTMLNSDDNSPDAALAMTVPAGDLVSPPVAAKPAPTAGTLLRPEVKLAYLTFRSGLRDHHAFPNVRLTDLGFGTAVGTVDLLVCDAGFNYVAAIDVYSGEQPADIAKTNFLRNAGVRYLTLAANAMPRPAQLRDLVYGEPGS